MHKKYVGDESKEHFLDISIDRVLFNALTHGTANTGLYRISNLR
jgi:hypothetical protein